MRIFFSVGEPSGDLHGSNLIKHLKSADPSIEFVGFGGPKMAAAGCTLLYDLTTMAVMFIGEVIKNLRFFFGLVDQADDYFAKNNVDAVVLIDYPGFNWWIAKKAKRRGIPVFYYGVPQMWAWAPWRARKIRKYVDHVLCKLPFEVEWFAKRNCHATYVGHPYFDQLENQNLDAEFTAQITQELGLNEGKPLVLLLPGSRNREVETNLPLLLDSANEIARHRPNVNFAVACYNEKHRQRAEEMLSESKKRWVAKSDDHETTTDIRLFENRTPELMGASTACIACSGSVSLELLYHRKPTVIVYKVKRWLMAAQAIFIRTQFITLTNLINAKDIRKTTWAPSDPEKDDVVMPEYLTVGAPIEKIASHILGWLGDSRSMGANIARLDRLAIEYAKPGATGRAAEYILEELQAQSEPHCSSRTAA
jgi:lipid-A-disaccharide synthase